MKYYEVHRTQTCKAIGSKSDWYTWNKDIKQFSTMAEVKEFLKKEYGTCKRSKMYIGDGVHVGYIYHYNSPKATYDDCAKNNQDWTEIREIKATVVL